MVHPKTAYVLLWFPEPTETFIYREVKNLAERGLPLTVFTLYGHIRKSLTPLMHSPPVPVERLGARALPILLMELVYWFCRRPGATAAILGKTFLRRWGGTVRAGENLWATLCGFRLAHRFLELGIANAHAPWAGGPATAIWVASSLSGVPFSFTARARDLYIPDGALPAKVRAAAFIRVNTKTNLRYLRGLYPGAADKIHCIYNGVNPSMGKGNTPALNSPFRLLAVGRFVGKKGYDRLLRACAELAARGLDFTLTLAGDGPLDKPLRRLTSELGLDARVTFTGFVPYHGIPRLFAAADVFVMSSVVDASGDRDGIPNVLMEALLYGIPVVATDVSGIGELVRDGETGLLVPPDDVDALAKAILKTTSAPGRAREMARRGRLVVLEEFDPDNSCRRITELIEGAATGPGEG